MRGRSSRPIERLQPGGAHRRPVRGAAGRICSVDGCSTVLSAYNRAERCALHDAPAGSPPRTRRRAG